MIPRLAAAIRDSPAGHKNLPDGQNALIIYDAKLDSEMGPYGDACKTTAIRMPNFKRLMTVVRCARGAPAAEILPQRDVLVVSDGFHPIDTKHILDAISERVGGGESEEDDPEDRSKSRGGGRTKKKRVAAPPRTLKHLMLVHDEASLASRRMRSSRGFMAVKQVETLLCISSSQLANLRARVNLLHSGSTNGQVLGGAFAPNMRPHNSVLR